MSEVSCRATRMLLEVLEQAGESVEDLADGLPVTLAHLRDGSRPVESTPGVGSTFRVALPAAAPDADVAPPPPFDPDPPPPAETGRGRVLVVDDERMLLRSLDNLLGADHEVVTVARAGEALALLLGDFDFDLVLCDLMMVDMSGMQLYERLRAARPGRERCLVFMTGGAFTEEAREFVRSVPNLTLDKPLDPAALRRLVAERVEARAAARG